MSVTDLSPHGPADLPVRVAITWHELLRTPDRHLRRLLAERYRQSIADERTLAHVLAEVESGTMSAARRHQAMAMLDAECERLEAVAQARYRRMADRTARDCRQQVAS